MPYWGSIANTQESRYKMQILSKMLTMTHSAMLEKSRYYVSGALRKS